MLKLAALSIVVPASFVQKGGKAAFSTAGLLYALKGWSLMRQVQTVLFLVHDVLSFT